ncbi:anti-phage dCTP deaminase [Sphingopyxis sp. LARHCG72]
MNEEDQKRRPDLYVGFVCAAGTDLTEIKAQFEAQLSVVGYSKKDVKVSQLIKSVLEIADQDSEFERMKALMAGGDKLRRHSQSHQGVASLTISEIRRLRGGEDDLPSSTVYLIDSLKNPAEVELLDRIYGRNFYTISVYVPKEERTENLKNKIAKSLHEPPGEAHQALAAELIDEDEKGAEKADQDVQGTFPLADFFINSKIDVKSQITRFVQLVFGEPFATPTRDEYFMFLAKATALRSCDLSRQVGAVIADERGWVLATGCNEVPLPGGGFYDESVASIEDNRDKKKQYDPNYIEIQRSLIEFIGVLKKAKFVDENESDSNIVDRLLHGEFKELMSNARVRNLIEFGRVVHAEMHALSQAAAAGRAVQDATLYCTTFPCHGCARHLIAAGIKEVIYIEPYPKSLTLHLYDKEIVIAHSPAGEHEVRARQPVSFRAFHGISPTLYQRVFAYRPRKDNMGTIAEWKPRIAIPVGAAFGVERPQAEVAASQAIAKILESIKLEADNEKAENENASATSQGS